MSDDITLRPGQLWWDRDHCWCGGATDIDVCFLLLSADEEEGFGLVWRCAQFMWISGAEIDGYCGAHDRKFLEGEVRKLVYVGGIESIKGFKQ